MSENTDHQAVAVREATAMPAGAPPPALAAMAISVQDVIQQAVLIQQVAGAVMRDGEHYGVIPGTSGKKSLLKSGAEKLCFTFGLAPRLDIRTENLPGGHREITVICDLYDRAGNHRGQGVGSASTMESKYRYRGAAGKTCPKCGAQSCKPSKKEYGGGYFCDRKSGGCGVSFKNGTPESKQLDATLTIRAENPDPADQYNTVLKMAKKRALVDATLTATAASDIFAQDLDELEGRLGPEEAVAQPAAPQAARTGRQQQAEPRQRAKRTHPASDTQAHGDSGQKQDEPEQPAHPAVESAKALYRRLVHEAQSREAAGRIIERVSRLCGGDTPLAVPSERLDDLGERVSALSSCQDIDGMAALLHDWDGGEA